MLKVAFVLGCLLSLTLASPVSLTVLWLLKCILYCKIWTTHLQPLFSYSLNRRPNELHAPVLTLGPMRWVNSTLSSRFQHPMHLAPCYPCYYHISRESFTVLCTLNISGFSCRSPTLSMVTFFRISCSSCFWPSFSYKLLLPRLPLLLNLPPTEDLKIGAVCWKTLRTDNSLK